MATTSDVPEFESEENANFACCKKKVNSTLVCITCGKVFHSSCAIRDWRERVKILGKTRLVCKHHEGESPQCLSADKGKEKDVEIIYLKELLVELRSKNQILEENSLLLREKVKNLEEKQSKNEDSKVDKKPKQTERREETITISDSSSPPLPKNIQIVENENVNKPSLQSPMKKKPEGGRRSEVKEKVNSNDKINTKTNISKNIQECEAPEVEIDPKNDKNWQTVSYKQRGYKRPTTNTRPEPLKGLSDGNTVLKAAQRMSFLFLSGLAPEVTSEMVTQYLESKNLKAINCEKMKTKKEKQRSSFKLTVPHQHREQYFNGDLWPRGVIINHFLNIQSHTRVNYQKSIYQKTPNYPRNHPQQQSN